MRESRGRQIPLGLADEGGVCPGRGKQGSGSGAFTWFCRACHGPRGRCLALETLASRTLARWQTLGPAARPQGRLICARHRAARSFLCEHCLTPARAGRVDSSQHCRGAGCPIRQLAINNNRGMMQRCTSEAAGPVRACCCRGRCRSAAAPLPLPPPKHAWPNPTELLALHANSLRCSCNRSRPKAAGLHQPLAPTPLLWCMLPGGWLWPQAMGSGGVLHWSRPVGRAFSASSWTSAWLLDLCCSLALH